MYSRSSRCPSTAACANSTIAGFRRTMRTAVRCPPAVFMRARFVTCSMSFNDTRMPETSIIIRTYNEEKHLPELFRRLGEHEYRDFETIIVDSRSIDRPPHISSAFADRLIPTRKHHFSFASGHDGLP